MGRRLQFLDPRTVYLKATPSQEPIRRRSADRGLGAAVVRAPRSMTRRSKVCPIVWRQAVPAQETSAVRNPVVWIAKKKKAGVGSEPMSKTAKTQARLGPRARGAAASATPAEQSGKPREENLQRRPECRTKTVGGVDTGQSQTAQGCG